MSAILNFLTALSAWGLLAGIIINSPVLTLLGLPEMIISASPSSISTMASNGAVCPLRPWPLSNEKIVSVPVFFSIMVRLRVRDRII